MPRHRVAIVGNGGIYRLAHRPVWQDLARRGRVQVVATCDLDEGRAKQARGELGAQAHYTELGALLDHHRDIDLVDICTPSGTHAELAIRTLEAGKHVICEKPMAMTVADASRMIQTAKRVDRGLFIGHTRRFDDRWMAMREAIEAGRIGDPVAVRRTERSWGSFPQDDWHWDFRVSGGALMDLGVHVADLFTWFFGRQPLSVYAKGLTIRPEARKSGCYDFGVILVTYPDGRRGLMEVSWASPQAIAPFYASTEVIGTKGKIEYQDRATAPMTVVDGGIDVPRYSPLLSSMPHCFERELTHFLDCIDQGHEGRVTVEQARAAVHVVTAAFRSIAEGRPVRLQ